MANRSSRVARVHDLRTYLVREVVGREKHHDTEVRRLLDHDAAHTQATTIISAIPLHGRGSKIERFIPPGISLKGALRRAPTACPAPPPDTGEE